MVFARQKSINLKYEGKEVGHHRLDFSAEDEVAVRIEAVESRPRIFAAQLLTDLNAAGKKVGLTINFNLS